MTASINTARSLLSAKNYNGARRMVQEMLENEPENMMAWILRIEIEMEAGEFKQALEYSRQVLSSHPDKVAIREQELLALMRLRKKKEAKQVFEKFKTDFPHNRHEIQTLQMGITALEGNSRKLRSTLEAFDDNNSNPYLKRSLGISYHNINDMFRAQKLMEEAYPHFPDDEELGVALAANSFQINRPATARKFARATLAHSPANKQMRNIIPFSYTLYFPYFYILNAIISTIVISQIFISKILSYILFAIILYLFINFMNIFPDIIALLSGVSFLGKGYLYQIPFIFIYLFVVDRFISNNFLRNKKSVKLKKY